jgi:hypothetical protein
MIESNTSIPVKRPAWFIFSFLADIEGNPIWEQFEMQAIKITPGEVGLGVEYRLLHRNYEKTLRVTGYEKDRLLKVKTIEASAPKVELCFRLHPTGDSLTEVSTEWKLETGSPAILERLMAGKIKTAVLDGFYQLRDLLETGSIELDDGREINI